MVNRSVLIVRAKEPFVQWLKSLPDPSDISLEEINEDSTAYLLPDYSYDNEQDEILASFYELIFEEQLAGWWTDESTGRLNGILQCSTMVRCAVSLIGYRPC